MNSESDENPMGVGMQLGAVVQLTELYAVIESQADQHLLPLAQNATDIVPGEGSSTAQVLFIGEAPGEQEAKQRRPFVGRSGQLLRKNITEIGLEATQFYIANVVKVRPPENRDPSLDEIEAFRPFLEQEIKIIAPKLIVTLGRFSMAAFLPDGKISQVHGRLHKVTYNDLKYFVLPLYHPAAALRNGKMLTAFKEDMQKIPKILAWITTTNETGTKSNSGKIVQNDITSNLESEIVATLLQ